MDDEFGLFDLGEPMPQQVGGGLTLAEPIPDVDFGQPDKNELNRLNQGMSIIQRQTADGTLSPEQGEYAKQQVARLRAPLLQKKAESEKRMIQTMTQQALGASAMERAREQQDMQHRAQSYLGTMVTDPETGARLMQSEAGKWTQVKKEPQEEGFVPPEPPKQYEPAPGPNPYRDQEGALHGTKGEQDAIRAARADIDRQKAAQTPEDQAFGLSSGSMNRLRQQATFLSNGDPRAARAIMPRLISAEVQGQRQQRALAYKEQKEQEATHAKEWRLSRKDHLKDLIDNWEKRNKEEDGKTPKAMPDETVAEINKQADLLADQDHVNAYGEDHLPKPRRAARQPKAETAPQPKEVKPTAQANDAAKQLAALLAERQRREAAKRAAAAPVGQIPMPDVDPQTGTRTMSRFR